MAYNVTFQSELILCVPQSASAVAMIALAALIYCIIRLIRHMKRKECINYLKIEN